MKEKDVVYWGRVFRVVGDCLPEFCFVNPSDMFERELITWAKKQPENVTVSGLWHPVVQNEILLKRGSILQWLSN